MHCDAASHESTYLILVCTATLPKQINGIEAPRLVNQVLPVGTWASDVRLRVFITLS